MTAWDTVTSRDAAEALCREGQLVKTLLFPSELGGGDAPENIVFLPPEAQAAKDRTTADLIDLFRRGDAERLAVMPEYRGDSFVPARILISAWKAERAAYDRPIEVW